MSASFFTPQVPSILTFYPNIQAVYVFGSVLESLSQAKDVDIALLLPPAEAASAGPLALSDLKQNLEKAFEKPVDLINLRLASVVFRKEIIFTGTRVYTGNEAETEIFEMLTLSLYQKLNEERKAILEQFYLTRRAYEI